MTPRNHLDRIAKPLMLSLCLTALVAGCAREPEEAPAPVADSAVNPAVDEMATEPAAAVVVATMPPPPVDTDNTEVPVDLIVVTPAAYLGQPVVGTAQVAEVPSDRGFWLEKDGQRIFAVIAQSPNMEEAVNIEAGQTIRLAGLVYDSALAEGIAGQIDPQTLEVIADQPAFLLVPATHVAVMEAPAD